MTGPPGSSTGRGSPAGFALAAAAAAIALHPAAPAGAQETTRVMVRAVSNDAKVIGSAVGGAQITIREAATGEVLAEGVQEGATGSTEAIMLTPRLRGLTAYASDPEAAGFLAALALDRPTRVEVTAEGPLDAPQAIQRASKTLLLIPGHDILGEGVVLVLHGLTVEILAPGMEGPAPGGEAGPPEGEGGEAAMAPIEPVAVEAGPIEVRARVTMLCGCPTEPGGMWDSEQIEMSARLLLDGEVVAEIPLAYSGETSVHVGTLPDPGPGPAAIEVLAADPARANLGMARRQIVISR